MRSKISTALLACTLVMSVGIPTASALFEDLGLSGKEPTVEEQRAEVRKIAQDTLQDYTDWTPVPSGGSRGQ